MKNWSKPALVELSTKKTQQGGQSETVVDYEWTTNNGQFEKHYSYYPVSQVGPE